MNHYNITIYKTYTVMYSKISNISQKFSNFFSFYFPTWTSQKFLRFLRRYSKVKPIPESPT